MAASVEKLRRSDQMARELGDKHAEEYLRSREAAEERRKAMVFEARLFTEREGIPIHWTVGGEDVVTLENNVNELVEWLDANEFAPHTGFGNSSAPAAPRQTARSQNAPPRRQQPARTPGRAAPPRRQAQQNAVTCDFCGGDTWDNAAKKASGEFKPNSPDYSCKDRKGCGAAAWWDEELGELDWKAGNS